MIRDVVGRAEWSRWRFNCTTEIPPFCQFGQPVLKTVKKKQNVQSLSLPIFEHHYGHRHSGQFTIGDRGRAVQHGRLQQVLAEMIRDAVQAEFAGQRKTVKSMPSDLIVQYVASTFVLVLDWWVDTKNPLPPKDVDEAFRALVLPTLLSVRV